MALATTLGPFYTGNMISVLIVDEHEQVRRALEACLRTAADLQVVKSIGQYALAVQDARNLAPEVILLETKAQEGIATLQAIRVAAPHSAVIVLTSYSDSREEENVLALGAVAYLLKTLDTQALLQAIRRAGSIVANQRAGDAESLRLGTLMSFIGHQS